MATVRPKVLERDALKNPFRGGEHRVHAQCAALPDSWFALYGVAWMGASPSGGATEGEADFVFVGPDIGLIVLEVKGGRVGRDDEGWFTVNRKGERFLIRDPVRQAQDSKHEFKRMLQLKLPVLASRYLPTTHVVCFPDVSRRDVPSLPDLPPQLRICGDDLEELAKKLIGAAEFANGGQNLRTLTVADCRLIADTLKPNFASPSRWSLLSRTHEAIIDALTEEQQRILGYLSANRMLGLTGPAGAGKTVVALRWARDLLRNGKRVLCVHPTNFLENYYRTLLPETTGVHFVRPNTLRETTLLKATRWDAIIADEAQDLPLEVWDELERMLEGPSTPSLLAVYDSNQRLASRDSFYLPRGLTEVYLDRVIRNTQQIAALSARFFRDERRTLKFAGPEGVAVQEITVTTSADLPNAVGSFIRRLVTKEGFDFSDIVVLCGQDGRLFLRRDKEAPKVHGVSYRFLQNSWDAGLKHPMVACGPVASFRGMESPVVILTDIDEMLSQDLVEACYVGMSRARYLLALVGRQETLLRIRQGPQD